MRCIVGLHNCPLLPDSSFRSETLTLPGVSDLRHRSQTQRQGIGARRTILTSSPPFFGWAHGVEVISPRASDLPNFTDADYMAGKSDDDFCAIIDEGNGGMPGFGSSYSSQDIYDVITDTRTFAE